MMWHRWSSALLAAALVLAACSERTPSEPEATPPLEEDLALGATTTGDHQALPTLHLLLRQAFRKVAQEQGVDAAHALVSGYRSLLEEAKAAREAHDRALLRQKLTAARAEAARIVIEVLGEGVVQRVIDAVAAALTEIDAKLTELRTAGHDVTRLERAAATAAELNQAALDALAADDPARALDLATRAADLARGLRMRLRHLGG